MKCIMAIIRTIVHTTYLVRATTKNHSTHYKHNVLRAQHNNK